MNKRTDSHIKPIIIVGPHKSGTSAVAGAIYKLGVDLGEKLLNADAYNIYGHFEDTEFIKINDKLLEKAGGSWHHPPTRLKIRHAAALLGEDLEQYIQKKVKRSKGFWGWKDPRTCLSLSVWLSYFPEAKLIVCRRNPQQTSRSLFSRDKNRKGYDCTPEYARLLTDYYNDEINVVIFGLKRDINFIEVGYEDLLNNPKNELARIAKFVGIRTSYMKMKQATKTIHHR